MMARRQCVLQAPVIGACGIRKRKGDALFPVLTPAMSARNRKRRKLLRVLRHHGVTGNLPTDWTGFPAEVVDNLEASYKDRSCYCPPEYQCPHSRASFWFEERVKSSSSWVQRKIVYNLCWEGGKVVVKPFRNPPALLSHLLSYDGDHVSKQFLTIVPSSHTGGATVGKKTIVSSSHTGGQHYYQENFQDGLAICRVHGAHDIFTTFTCNLKLLEIAEALMLESGQKTSDRADIIVMVYYMKLNEYLDEIKSARACGPINYVLYTVEFQK